MPRRNKFPTTGYRTDGLLDVHLVSDTDIKEHSSFAVKIDAITDPARKLPMKDSQTEARANPS
jgi:hypothetical protein